MLAGVGIYLSSRKCHRLILRSTLIKRYSRPVYGSLFILPEGLSSGKSKQTPIIEQIPTSAWGLGWGLIITSYKSGLFSVNPTNQSPTIHLHLNPPCSLKTVSANTPKELQNVLPNGNLFGLEVCYPIYRSPFAPLPCYYGERVGVRGFSIAL